jgi:hypothetical protein
MVIVLLLLYAYQTGDYVEATRVTLYIEKIDCFSINI